VFKATKPAVTFVLAVLELKLRVLYLLGRSFTTWVTCQPCCDLLAVGKDNDSITSFVFLGGAVSPWGGPHSWVCSSFASGKMFVILLVTSQFCFWVLSAISPGVYCCFRERSKGLKLVTLADCPLKKEKINASLETLPNNSYFHAIGPNWVTCPSLAARVWGGGHQEC
jgi:hypothetical protein